MPPAGEHRATVFWLHGLGADGHDFLPILPALRLSDSLGVRFVFPEAPFRPVTINGGMVMRAWYDIEALSREGHAHRDHLAAAVIGIRGLIEQEQARGIPPERMVLAGFSQGGAVALQTAAGEGPDEEAPPRLGGVLAMSCYLPFPERVVLAGEHAAPVFQAHGSTDDIVPLPLGIRSREVLRTAGWEVDFRTYSMGHQISEAEIRDGGLFLRRVLSAGSGAR